MEFIKVVIGYSRDRVAYDRYMAAVKELRFLPGFSGEYDRATFTTTVYVVAPEISPAVAAKAE
jgi:hypothetical protein